MSLDLDIDLDLPVHAFLDSQRFYSRSARAAAARTSIP